MPSTVVDSFIYDEDSRILTVTFVSGLIYDYLDVPPHIFEKMKTARSKGSFLNKEIKGRFGFIKVESAFKGGFGHNLK